MLFNSLEFLLFFIGLLLILLFCKQNKQQKMIYLLASYFFYMWWNPIFIFLILFSTLTDFFLGQKIYSSIHKREWLMLSILSNLGVLVIFKYGNFFQANLLWLWQSMGKDPSWTSVNILLPIGISFFTFQTLSYSIDIFRGHIAPTKDPLDFALFVGFFPQLIAGPILRAKEFLPQLNQKRDLNFSKLNLILISKGLFKKVIIADNLAFIVDRIYENPELYPSLFIWIAAIAFYIQIYCDFSGYTDIAIGLAGILGFSFPKNFNFPYFSRTIREFWQKWHMTLSAWLRDYLYIPLGGNKLSTFSTVRNVLITMLLGGLWHGANWNFIFWGAFHAMLIIGYRILKADKKLRGKPFYNGSSILSFFILQYLIILSWILFRIEDLPLAITAMAKFLIFDFDLDFNGLSIGTMQLFSSLLLMFIFFVLHTYSYMKSGIEHILSKKTWPELYFMAMLGFLISYFFIPSGEQAFIYFQF